VPDVPNLAAWPTTMYGGHLILRRWAEGGVRDRVAVTMHDNGQSPGLEMGWRDAHGRPFARMGNHPKAKRWGNAGSVDGKRCAECGLINR
jgi:hypothetical protein